MTDLFLSDKARLLEWLRTKKYVKTSEVIQYGATHFSNRALRNAQALCQEGKLKRLTDDDVRRHFGETNEGAWEVLDNK